MCAFDFSAFASLILATLPHNNSLFFQPAAAKKDPPTPPTINAADSPSVAIAAPQVPTRRIVLVGGSGEDFCLFDPYNESHINGNGGYNRPHEATVFKTIPKVSSSTCTKVSNAFVTEDGKAWTSGTNAFGVLGRILGKDLFQPEDAYPNDKEYGYEREQCQLLQVVGFYPNNNQSNQAEDESLIKVTGGENHLLWLTEDGNVYFNGILQDEDYRKFAFDPKGEIVRLANESPSTFWTRVPFHLKLDKRATDIASGQNFATITLEDGSHMSFGFGNQGELARRGTKAMPFVIEKDSNGKDEWVPTSGRATEEIRSYFPYHNQKVGARKTTIDTGKKIDLGTVAAAFMTPTSMYRGAVRGAKLAHGNAHSLALEGDKLYGIGDGHYGQLGLGTNFAGMTLEENALLGANGLLFALERWTEVNQTVGS